MSSIKMKSEDIIEKCNLVLQSIEKVRESQKNRLIESYIKKKNNGFVGWFRKMFGKQYDVEKASRDCERDKYEYDSHWSRVWFWNSVKTNALSLIRIAKTHTEIYVSCEDYEQLERVIEDAPFLIKYYADKAEKI